MGYSPCSRKESDTTLYNHSPIQKVPNFKTCLASGGLAKGSLTVVTIIITGLCRSTCHRQTAM